MKTIESLEQWNELAIKLREHNYRICQLQYDPQAQDGFHVWFSKLGKPDFEVVTHYEDVHSAMVNYK